jgi:hypothetical protein
VRHLGLAVLLALFSIAAYAEEWTHSYPVTGKPELVVDANDADVEISVGSSQQVEARVIVHGWKINENLQISGTQSGNRVELKLHKTQQTCFGWCNQSIRVEVHVPRESDLAVHTGDGNIRVDNVSGNLQLETKDGDVRIRDVEGSLHAETHDGNVNVTGRFDLLSLHTGDGDIDAELAASSGLQSATSQSGGRQSGASQTGWMVRTGDGNVRLRLPDNFAADLDVHSGDGNVRVDFPITTAASTGENSLRGKINGGGVSLEVRTGDGDIRVEKM